MKKLWFSLLLTACALLLAASAACGGDDDDGAATNTARASASASAAATADETAEPTDDSDDDDDDDGDYYNELADILNQADRDTNDIAQNYSGPYDDTADEVDQTESAFTETADVLEGVVAAMGDLEPPSDAEDAHNTYMSTLAASNELFGAAADALDGIETEVALDAYKDEYGPLLNQASEDIENNCVVLQGLADDAGSDADLGCSEQD